MMSDNLDGRLGLAVFSDEDRESHSRIHEDFSQNRSIGEQHDTDDLYVTEDGSGYDSDDDNTRPLLTEDMLERAGLAINAICRDDGDLGSIDGDVLADTSFDDLEFSDEESNSGNDTEAAGQLTQCYPFVRIRSDISPSFSAENAGPTQDERTDKGEATAKDAVEDRDAGDTDVDIVKRVYSYPIGTVHSPHASPAAKRKRSFGTFANDDQVPGTTSDEDNDTKRVRHTDEPLVTENENEEQQGDLRVVAAPINAQPEHIYDDAAQEAHFEVTQADAAGTDGANDIPPPAPELADHLALPEAVGDNDYDEDEEGVGPLDPHRCMYCAWSFCEKTEHMVAKHFYEHHKAQLDASGVPAFESFKGKDDSARYKALGRYLLRNLSIPWRLEAYPCRIDGCIEAFKRPDKRSQHRSKKHSQEATAAAERIDEEIKARTNAANAALNLPSGDSDGED
ncbi:hypothetical protein BC835DRAFT_576691 [Cytidiella melzeri]|nr:hypothetical protein BC835DRAFT_576691 [Cytidiella melzeri]